MAPSPGVDLQQHTGIIGDLKHWLLIENWKIGKLEIYKLFRPKGNPSTRRLVNRIISPTMNHAILSEVEGEQIHHECQYFLTNN